VLSKINKTGGLPGEGTIIWLLKIAKELRLWGSYNSIGPCLIIVGGMGAS
jgi:hypothetical protein